MSRRREFPSDLSPTYRDINDAAIEPTVPPHSPVACGEYRPDSIYEALMQAPPAAGGDVPRALVRELRDVIVDAVDGLNERERLIFDATIIERKSLRALGESLGYRGPHYSKTSVARERDRVLGKLRDVLSELPEINLYLEAQ